PTSTLGGSTAAMMHAINCNPATPVGVILAQASPVRSWHGLKVRHCELPEHDLMKIKNLPATNILRTLRDLCLTRSPLAALIALDMAVRGGLAARPGLLRYAQDAAGLPGAG